MSRPFTVYSRKNQYELYNKSRYMRFVAHLNRLKMRPCLDCHIQYAPWIMAFDHREPATKSYDLGCMANMSKIRIDAELAKCDIVCANCHAARTHIHRLAGKI